MTSIHQAERRCNGGTGAVVASRPALQNVRQ
jgi:hypothetical protein